MSVVGGEAVCGCMRVRGVRGVRGVCGMRRVSGCEVGRVEGQRRGGRRERKRAGRRPAGDGGHGRMAWVSLGSSATTQRALVHHDRSESV